MATEPWKCFSEDFTEAMHGQKLAECMALVTPQKALALIIGNVTCYYCSSGAVVIVVVDIITTAPGQQRSTELPMDFLLLTKWSLRGFVN